MKKALFTFATLAAFFLAGCAGSGNSKSASAFLPRFMTETMYIYTEIPEPMEIDLKFITKHSDYKYSQPIFTYERSFASFTYIKDDVITRVMAMAPRFMKADTAFHPPENATDQEYINFHIKYALSNFYPDDAIGEITYDSEKNYGITCIYPKDQDIIHCEAIRITPHRNVVVVEMKSPTRSEDNVKEWVTPVIESVVEKTLF